MFPARLTQILSEIDPTRSARLVKRSLVASIVVIFLLDVLTPLGVALPALYALPIFLASLLCHLEHAFFLAVGVTVLTFLGYLYSPTGTEPLIGDVNRIIATLLTWASLFAGWLLGGIHRAIKASDHTHHE